MKPKVLVEIENINNKIDKDYIVNDLTTGGIYKVASAETVKLLDLNKVDKESPNFTGTPKINGNEIATINNIPSGLSLGETSSTAYRGDRGKTAYDHSQSTHAPSNAQKNSDITKTEIESKLTGTITSHTHTTINGFTVNKNVPANAIFTDTIYTHPATHPASIVSQDSSNRFVTDAEKSTWNNKAPAIQSGTSSPSSYIGAGVLYGVYS